MFASLFSRRARTTSASKIQPASFDGLEPLEARIAMSTVNWTGAGDGFTLNDRFNWQCNHLPGQYDTAVINVAANPEIQLNTGSFKVKKLLLSENLTVNNGTLEVGSGGTTVSASLSIAGGLFTGSGLLSTTGQLNWTAGQISGTGIIDIATTGRFNIFSTSTLELRRDIINRGRLEWSGGNIDGYDSCGTVITNKPGAIIKLTGEGRFRSLCYPGLLDNQGLIVRDTPGTSLFLVPSKSSGCINVAGGTLQLWGGGSNSGQRNVAQGAILHYYGNFTHNAGSTLAGGGSTIWQGGTHTIAADQSMHSYLYISNSTVTGPGLWTIDGVIGWSHGRIEGTGGTVVSSTGKIEIRTTGQHTLARDIDNQGTLIWNRGDLTLEGATITNRPGRSFFINASATATAVTGQNLIINQGEIRKVGTGAAGLGGINLDNTGMVYVRNGSLTLDQGTVQQLSAAPLTGSTLTGGSWKVFGTGNLNLTGHTITTVGADATVIRIGRSAGLALESIERNDGTIDISGGGSLDLTPATGVFTNAGTLTLNDATTLNIQGDFVQESTGRLEIYISNPAALGTGRVISAYSATLAGTAAAVPLTFTPQAGQTFLFLTAQTVIGQFDTIEFSYGPTGLVDYMATGVLFVY